MLKKMHSRRVQSLVNYNSDLHREVNAIVELMDSIHEGNELEVEEDEWESTPLHMPANIVTNETMGCLHAIIEEPEESEDDIAQTRKPATSLQAPSISSHPLKPPPVVVCTHIDGVNETVWPRNWRDDECASPSVSHSRLDSFINIVFLEGTVDRSKDASGFHSATSDHPDPFSSDDLAGTMPAAFKISEDLHPVAESQNMRAKTNPGREWLVMNGEHDNEPGRLKNSTWQRLRNILRGLKVRKKR
ncbi:MAG: hypothetical protein M1820_000220 [Bogoriella megaspora]|nr:MAG: hypothetical protein M1820_000220 [Bogoriella megaspora]